MTSAIEIAQVPRGKTAGGQNEITKRKQRASRMPNEALAKARLAREWTQAELAEEVAAHIWHTTGRETGIDADYISRLERGVITWPTKLTRTALEAVLGASVHELGLVNRRLGGGARRPTNPPSEPPTPTVAASSPADDAQASQRPEPQVAKTSPRLAARVDPHRFCGQVRQPGQPLRGCDRRSSRSTHAGGRSTQRATQPAGRAPPAASKA